MSSDIFIRKKITEVKGFTLIELLIAVVILSILAGFAMMQYNRYKITSYNSTAETDMRNLMTFEMAFLTGHQTFVAFNVEDISDGGVVKKTVTLPDGSTEEFKFIGFSPGVRGCVKVQDEKFANGGVKHNKGTKYIGYDFDTGIFLHKFGDIGVKLQNSDIPDVEKRTIAEWSGWEKGLGK